MFQIRVGIFIFPGKLRFLWEIWVFGAVMQTVEGQQCSNCSLKRER